MTDLTLYSMPSSGNSYKARLLLAFLGRLYAHVGMEYLTPELDAAHASGTLPLGKLPVLELPDGTRLPESNAILTYLAEKTGRFLPTAIRERADTLQWLNWQMGGLGPMAGQNHHFVQYAPERIKYAMDRYVNETNRLYGVLNKRLADREFVAGEYSIADMASYPWIVPHERQQQNLDDFPHLKRWFDAIKARPAPERAYALAKTINQAPTMSEEAKKIMFGQTAANVN